MKLFGLFIVPVFLLILTGSVYYLLFCLKKYRGLIPLIGLFSLTMGFFLLLLDLVLITFTHGVEHIPSYLLFNRLVSDGGFAGRWVLTVYIFMGIGFGLTIYLLARNLINKFNT